MWFQRIKVGNKINIFAKEQNSVYMRKILFALALLFGTVSLSGQQVVLARLERESTYHQTDCESRSRDSKS